MLGGTVASRRESLSAVEHLGIGTNNDDGLDGTVDDGGGNGESEHERVLPFLVSITHMTRITLRCRLRDEEPETAPS